MDNVSILLDDANNGEKLGPSNALLAMLESNEEEEADSDISVTNNNKPISPRNPVQMTDVEQQTDLDLKEDICKKCQSLEDESKLALTQTISKFETEIARLRKEVETANKAKEATVMRYAKSENEVIKLKRDLESSSKQITGLMKEVETLNKKQKMLSSERERLGNIVDGKNCEAQALQKEIEKLKEDISAKEFKIKWTQNKLSTEMEAHQETRVRVENLESELENARQSSENHASWSKSASDRVNISVENGSVEESVEAPETDQNDSSPCEEIKEDLTVQQEKTNLVSTSIIIKELEAVKARNQQLIEENNVLSCKVQTLEEKRLDLEQKLARLQESNSEHLHQIATLQSELAATESMKSQLAREQETVLALQKECQQVRLTHTEIMADMAVCRSKEAELLEYTQQVTEKNVTLQSEFSSIQAKSFALEEENERLRNQIEQQQVDIKNLEKMMSQECKNYIEERQNVQNDAEKQKNEIVELQRQLDEARGEIVLLHKSLNSKIKELNRELQAARRNMKDGASGSDGMSQSSRASSSSSLNNVEVVTPPKPKQDDISEKSSEPDATPVIPDQQLMIERIVKLQRNLAKKQEKIEFLHEHVKQLTETLQKKTRIITAYAMNQDVEALSSELSEKNKAEVVKYGGIMASVYASKPSDDGLTLDLSLEINRKLQIVLEDTLFKNITLKDSLNTLGKEISKLTESNNELLEKLSRNANPG